MKRFPLILIVALAAVFVAGCLAQPKDAVTGKPFGKPVSLIAGTQPTTSPDGHAVVLSPTSKPDVDGALTLVRDNAAKVGAIGGATGAAVGGLIGVLAGTLLSFRKKESDAAPVAVAQSKGPNANG